jgi:hypothetical protein
MKTKIALILVVLILLFSALGSINAQTLEEEEVVSISSYMPVKITIKSK